jgi:hypothetical protein
MRTFLVGDEILAVGGHPVSFVKATGEKITWD